MAVHCTLRRQGNPEAGYEVALAAVPPALAPYVESCTGYREWSVGRVQRVEAPSGRAVLIFELGTSIAVGPPQSGLTGLRRYRRGFYAALGDEPSLTAFEGVQEGIQVNLTPRGAHALLGRETRDFTGLVTELDALRLPESVSAALVEETSWRARISAVLHTLALRIEKAPDQSNVVRWAVERIDRSHGALRIDGLAQELGYSRKYLHARFFDEVGLAPKRYAELRRFQHVVERLRTGPVTSFARLAVETGYSDQAHLAREVRRFSGASSTALATSVRDPISLAVSGLE